MKNKGTNTAYKKIDANYLPKGYSTDQKERYYAEFYPDGQLKFYGFFIKGDETPSFYLKLPFKEQKGSCLDGKANHEYKNGLDVQSHGYFDDGKDECIEWEDWIKRCVQSIYESAQIYLEVDLKHLFTLEEARLIEKQLGSVKLGMDTRDMEDLVFERVNLVRGPFTIQSKIVNNQLRKTYRIREGYHFIVVCDEANPTIRELFLEGDGWLSETREFVKNMPHV
ncbi:MAG: hypothetical protein JW893_04895 [Candidatus Omnitrophica bacterium]|nr:hypothetical protein [Candidatus Omnitrophota bacterium]